MKRNEKTLIECLEVGDRFHKIGSKEVLQIMDTEKQIRTKSQKHFACPATYVDSKNETVKTIPVQGHTQVIFLRNVNDN